MKNTEPLKLEIPDELWEETGDFEEGEEGPSRLSLRNGLQIGSRLFHVDAIQVEAKEGVLVAVNSSLETDIELVAGLLGDAPQSIGIRGKHYVLYVVPYAE